MNAEAKLLAEIALNTAAIYLFLIVAIRLFGRRQLGQLSSIDLLVVILLGSAVETAMVKSNTSLKAGLVSAITLLVLNRAITLLMLKSRRFSHLVGAGPMLLVHNGHFVEENMKRVGMTKSDVVEAMRGRECSSIKNIKYAVFEPDGEINVVTFDEDGDITPTANDNPHPAQ